jgi:hypothetical protein
MRAAQAAPLLKSPRNSKAYNYTKQQTFSPRAVQTGLEIVTPAPTFVILLPTFGLNCHPMRA